MGQEMSAAEGSWEIPEGQPQPLRHAAAGSEREQCHLRVCGFEVRRWSVFPTGSKQVRVLGERSLRVKGPGPQFLMRPAEGARGPTAAPHRARRGRCPPGTHIWGRTEAREASPTRRGGRADLTQGNPERDLLYLETLEGPGCVQRLGRKIARPDHLWAGAKALGPDCRGWPGQPRCL